MKRSIILFLFGLMTLVGYSQNMASLFSNMPDQLIPQLESEWRKDLVDLYNNGKEARLQNTMTGYSTLQKLTTDYLLLQKTERSTLEMKMLPLVNNTYIICVVSTVSAPVADSTVEFFTTSWEPLNAEELFNPVSHEWFIKTDAEKTSFAYQSALSRLDIDLVKYQLSEKEQTLTATYTTPLYLSTEEREKVKPFLKESPKVFTWEKYRFN